MLDSLFALLVGVAASTTGSTAPAPHAQPSVRAPLVYDAKERKRALRSVGTRSKKAALLGIEWLIRHQDPDGSWSADRFGEHCGRARSCDGPGDPTYTIGVSALGALAVMSCGNMRAGDRDRESVERALTYLEGRQAESGLFGTSEQFGFIYNQALATLALAEAAIVLPDDARLDALQSAVDYIEAARNPHGGWRYDVPPSGESDTSVTAWMGTALYTARQAGAEVSTQAFEAAAEWVAQVTDPATGRCGYNEVGTRSSRIAGINNEVPLGLSEPLTAAGIFLRLIHGEDAQAGKIQKQFMLLDAKAPIYENGDCDMYYWFYGSLASHQAGGDRWRDWKRMVENVALPKQITRDDPKGSWDPDGAWGKPGGRVYATAICVLSLTTSARYAAVAGER